MSCHMGASYTMELTELDDLKFATPLVVTVSYDAEYAMWMAKNDALNLVCSGSSIQDLKTEIHDDLEFLRDGIMVDDDATLTKDAIAVKNTLKKLFGVV